MIHTHTHTHTHIYIFFFSYENLIKEDSHIKESAEKDSDLTVFHLTEMKCREFGCFGYIVTCLIILCSVPAVC